MNVKSSLIKKENKAYYGQLEKIVLTSSHFAHIMNYEMISIEFDEIVYKLLNRKIGNTHSKEEFVGLYKEAIRNMAEELKKVRGEVKKGKKSIGFNWKRESYKDKQR